MAPEQKNSEQTNAELFHSIEQGEGPVLLFLHGFMGSCEDWRPVMARLSPRFRCIAIDLPGHGQTLWSHEPNYRMEKTAEKIVLWLTQKQIKSAGLVGYSMGGRIALYCALTFPQLFPQAVVESGTAGLRKYKDRKARQNQDLARSHAIETDFLNFLSGWYQQPLFTSLWKHLAVFEEMQQRRRRNSPAGLSACLRQMGLGCQPNLWPLLPFHNQPLLLLSGEFDMKFCRINRSMARACPGARHLVLSGVGHNIHLEDPGAIAHHLQQFFGSSV